MTPFEIAGAVMALAGSAAGGGWLWRIVNRRQDAAHSAAETRKLNAEAGSVEGASWAAQVRQAIDLLEVYRKEVQELRAEMGVLQDSYDTLEDHVETLERLMRRGGLDVPQRPDRHSQLVTTTPTTPRG